MKQVNLLGLMVNFVQLSLSELSAEVIILFLTLQSSWSGFGAVRHGGAVCSHPASCRVPIGLYSPAALLQLRLPDSHWLGQRTCQAEFQVRQQEWRMQEGNEHLVSWFQYYINRESLTSSSWILYFKWKNSFCFCISILASYKTAQCKTYRSKCPFLLDVKTITMVTVCADDLADW